MDAVSKIEPFSTAYAPQTLMKGNRDSGFFLTSAAKGVSIHDPNGLNACYEQPFLRDPAPFQKRWVVDECHAPTGPVEKVQFAG